MFRKVFALSALLVSSFSVNAAIIPVTVDLSGFTDDGSDASRAGSGIGTYNSDSGLLSFDGSMDYFDADFNWLTIGYTYSGSNEADGMSVNTSCYSAYPDLCSQIQLNVPTSLPQSGTYIFYSNTIDATGNGVISIQEQFEAGSIDYLTMTVSSVPVPAAAWLFGSALIGLAGIKRKK